VGDIEGGIGIEHLDASRDQLASDLCILLFSVATLRIEHDAYGHASFVGRDYGIQEARIGEDEHLDSKRGLRRVDCIEKRLGGVVR
jgi:hypothetical protein